MVEEEEEEEEQAQREADLEVSLPEFEGAVGGAKMDNLQQLIKQVIFVEHLRKFCPMSRKTEMIEFFIDYKFYVGAQRHVCVEFLAIVC